MIYTLTPNLAIDLFIELDDFKANSVNRSNYCKYIPNGKGVNVSLTLKKLGIDSVITGFKAGFTGDYIDKSLKKENINTFLPEIEGITRVNVFTKVLNNGKEYKQVNPGPKISESAKEDLLLYLNKHIKEGDILTINGSFPEGFNYMFVEELASIIINKKAKLIVDNSSKFLPQLGKYRPYLIKPNEEEICSWFDEKFTDIKQIVKLSKKMIDGGFQNILLSIGEEGALFINKEKVLLANAPKGEVVNTSMAGDAMLATFISEKIKGSSDEISLVKSVAAGSSTAFTDGLTDFSDTEQLIEQIKIKNWR